MNSRRTSLPVNPSTPSQGQSRPQNPSQMKFASSSRPISWKRCSTPLIGASSRATMATSGPVVRRLSQRIGGALAVLIPAGGSKQWFTVLVFVLVPLEQARCEGGGDSGGGGSRGKTSEEGHKEGSGRQEGCRQALATLGEAGLRTGDGWIYVRKFPPLGE